MKSPIYYIVVLSLALHACNKDNLEPISIIEWDRETNPVLQDTIVSENYQTASDPHVFMDNNSLSMIYTGDNEGKPAIKLANANTINNWSPTKTLLGAVGPSGLDSHKETGFYRKASNGKHQIYYIGYNDEETYESQIFLAEADSLSGEYTQMNAPIIGKGLIVDKDVYCMTSPSVIEHQGLLYMTFIGWDDSPNKVTEVWVLGATSNDNGHSWNDFQLVDTRIGMEGQVTKLGDNKFIAVRTGDFESKEAIFYSTSDHPFGPWTELENPILVQAGPPYEKDAIIAPQIFIDPISNEEILFYTGADFDIGWWVMMAK